MFTQVMERDQELGEEPGIVVVAFKEDEQCSINANGVLSLLLQ